MVRTVENNTAWSQARHRPVIDANSQSTAAEHISLHEIIANRSRPAPDYPA